MRKPSPPVSVMTLGCPAPRSDVREVTRETVSRQVDDRGSGKGQRVYAAIYTILRNGVYV